MAPTTEHDPLLPNQGNAPEINWGNTSFLRHVTSRKQEVQIAEGDLEQDEQDSESITDSRKSALNTIIAMFTTVCFLAFLAMLLSPKGDAHNPVPGGSNPGPEKSIQERVNHILETTPLIDGHDDLAIVIRGAYHNKIQSQSFTNPFENGGFPYNVDLPRLKAGKIGGSFWSAFIACPANASYDYSDQNYATSVSRTLAQIDVIRRLQSKYSSTFSPATLPLSESISRFQQRKSLISPISIEGLHQVPQSAPMSTLRLYYALGVRAATLTWNCHNAFADAALISGLNSTTVAPYFRGGLTTAGRAVLKEMNRLGMLIDISHTSYWTQKAVLSNGTSAAPVVFTHSSAFALCPHPRNVQDDILDLVKATNSIVMINFSPNFISCLPPPNSSVLPEFYEQNNTLHQVARHVVYVGEKIGYDYVGFGSDFDGIGALVPKGLEGVDKYPDLVAELLRMGVSDSDASKIVGGNILRVWQAAEKVAQKMQADGVLEGEDDAVGY